MAVDVLMPALSPTMEQGKLAKWLKSEGDKIKSGDVIAEIETDKATMEVESIEDGILAKILIAGGTDNVLVNTRIAIIAQDGESVSDAPAQPAAASPAAAPSPTVAAAPKSEPPAHVVAYDASAEYPAGVEMVTMTVREALREAMAEEMRANPNVRSEERRVGKEC